MTKDEKAKDAVSRRVKSEFKERGFHHHHWEHDLTCFSATGTRCCIIFDKGDIDKVYLIVGLEMVGGEWEIDYWKKSGSHFDGIDAMCEADAFIHNYDE